MTEAALPHDIFDLWEYAGSPGWVLLLLLLAALGALIFAVWWWRRRQVGELSAAEVSVDWHERLTTLTLPDAWSLDTAKQFYFALSYVLRALFEHHGILAATDMTTQELRRALEHHRNAAVRSKLKPAVSLLQRADRVKFADELCLEQTARDDLREARHLAAVMRELVASVHTTNQPRTEGQDALC